MSSDRLSKGVLDHRPLPDADFEHVWDSIVDEVGLKDRLLCQAVLNFTFRPKIKRAAIPLHGIILLVGPPGTAKTSLCRGLASRTASTVKGTSKFHFLEVEPHALASASLGKSQQAVRDLLGSTIAERAVSGPLIVLLDEVETLAVDRARLSLEANPVDVHRATDAVLAQLDQLAASHPNLLFVATSNFPKAIDRAFLSRADLIAHVELPGKAACLKILADTVVQIATAFPKLRRLAEDPALKEAASEAVGLDGRRIRKAVISAFTHDKATALEPERLVATDIVRAVKEAKQESLQLEGGKK